MAKEFFMLLSQRILNPDIGMFVEDEESHLVWFRDGVSRSCDHNVTFALPAVFFL